MRRLRLFLTCFILLAGTSQIAKAADYGGLGLAYLYGYGGYNTGFTNRSFGPPPPYFALHPPVYYGQRYTRPYGASPFAAWPQLQSNAHYTPRRHVDRSQTISNPYVAGGVVRSSGPQQIVSAKPVQPLVIDNPYYKPDTVQYTKK